MDKLTLKALQGSIRKWREIAAGTMTDRGVYNCPLCLRFNPPNKDITVKDSSCHGCPVRDKTGKSYCDGTPYMAWDEAHSLDTPDEDRTAHNDELKQLAMDEVRFLESLLPAAVGASPDQTS